MAGSPTGTGLPLGPGKRGDDDDDISAACEKAAAEAQPQPTAQRNFTDPDARIMKTADGSNHHACTGQGVVDADHQVINATELNNVAIDIQQLEPMIKRAMDTVGGTPKTWSADAGFCPAVNLEHVKDVEAEHATAFFISARRMKHTAPIPDSPRGRIPANATPGERMARKLRTKKGKKIYVRRKASNSTPTAPTRPPERERNQKKQRPQPLQRPSGTAGRGQGTTTTSPDPQTGAGPARN